MYLSFALQTAMKDIPVQAMTGTHIQVMEANMAARECLNAMDGMYGVKVQVGKTAMMKTSQVFKGPSVNILLIQEPLGLITHPVFKLRVSS